MTLIAAVPGELLATGSGSAVWRGEAGRVEVLDAREARILALLATFRPESDVPAMLSRAGLGDAASALLHGLRARDLVRSVDAFVPQAAPAGVPQDPDPLLVIRAFERPQGFEALLASLAAEQERTGVVRRLAVVDDTRDAAAAARTEALLQDHVDRCGRDAWLLGPEARPRALAALIGGGASVVPPACRALLDPDLPCAVTGSRTWNWAVLLAAGGALSILDDDVLLPLRRPPGARGVFDLLDGNEPETRFEDPDEAWALPMSDDEAWRELGRWLGESPARLLARDGYRSDTMIHRSPRELIALGGTARVVGVVPGIQGSIPLDTSIYLVANEPGSQRDLWRAPYRPQRLDADRVWSGYTAPRITRAASYTPMLLDARELLPFAGTWGRVDDSLFLATLGAIAPDARFVHAPLLLGHHDPRPRARAARAREPLVPDRNAWLAHRIWTWGEALAGAGRTTRLEALAALAEDWARADDATLADDAERFRLRMVARAVQRIAALREAQPEAPSAWQEQADAVIAANRAGLSAAPDRAELAVRRQALEQFAAAMPYWTAWWRRAATLGPDALARRIVARSRRT